MKLPHLHQKGHAFYYVTPGTRKWIPLGSDPAIALKRYWRLRRTTSAGTIAAMLDGWLDTKRGRASPGAPELAPGTIEQYEAWCGHLIRVFGDMLPDELTRGDVLRYLDDCPRTSARGEISLLRQAFERAVRRGEVDDNPCIGAKPAQPRTSRRGRYLTDEEFARIYAAGTPLLKVALDLAYLTGLRPGDLCRLRWDDFEEGGHVRTQKTGARARYRLTDDLRAVLDAARALAGRVAPLTVLSERGRAVTRHRLGNLFRAACAAAEPAVKDAQLRDVRAKAATDADAAGQDAQRLLGHTTPQTTRTYLRGRQILTIDPVKRKKA